MALFTYLKYYWNAKTKYQVHSPFVFDFVENILEDKRYYYHFDAIEKYRKFVSANRTKITIANSTLSIKSIIKHSKITPKIGRILFRLLNHYQPKYAIEFGTSIGISALYQSAPSKAMTFYSLEKEPILARLVQKNFEILCVDNVFIEYGDINKNVSYVLDKIPQLEYVLFNDPVSISIMEQLLQKCTPNNTLFVLTHPHGEEEKQACWQWIKNHSSVTLTIDLYDIGLAFTREAQKEKTHFDLIKAAKKPWAMF